MSRRRFHDFQIEIRVYVGRVIGGDRDHRRFGGAVVARGASRAEAARASQCQSNLKQLGLALLNFEGARRSFPATDVANGFSAQARLLPYMEEANLQNLLDFTQPAFTGAYNAQVPNPLFAKVFATPIAVFLCPSDMADVINTETTYGSSFAGNNYMLSIGSGTNLFYDQRFPTDGITFYNSAVKFRDVTDGSANTVFMSESIRSVGVDMTLPADRLRRFPISTR